MYKNTISKKILENETKQLEAFISINSFVRPIAPLPQMRHWAISPDFAKVLIEQILIQKPSKIVEFGSGVSSVIIGYVLKKLGKGKLVSIDHDEYYANITKNNVFLHQLEEYVDIVKVPTKIYDFDNVEYKWYNLQIKKNFYNDFHKVDMLIVDGPPAAFNTESRYPALPIMYQFLSENAIIIMDDGIREDEKNICKQWVDSYPDFEAEYVNTEKGAYILRRKQDK